MNFMALLLVAFGASFAVIWLLTYIPLLKKSFGKTWSPRLFVINKLLGPFDAVVTLILVGGGWVGLTSALGISAMVYNVLSGIGLSLGVVVAKKLFAPRWQKQYDEEVVTLAQRIML